LVFDYFRDDPPDGQRRVIEAGVMQAELLADRPTIVLVSHGHADHYNPVIFKWRREADQKIAFVVDKGVRLPSGATAKRLSPGGTCDVLGAKVTAYPSTDLGCSFLVEVDGLSIFHAGDLNFWHWAEHSSAAEVSAAKAAFLAALEPMKGKAIDLAFFPVDGRLGAKAGLGAAHFAAAFCPRVLVPMHFTGHEDYARRFAEALTVDGVQTWMPDHRGGATTFEL